VSCIREHAKAKAADIFDYQLILAERAIMNVMDPQAKEALEILLELVKKLNKPTTLKEGEHGLHALPDAKAQFQQD